MREISVGEANVGDVVAEPVANDQGLVLPSGSKLSAAVLSRLEWVRGDPPEDRGEDQPDSQSDEQPADATRSGCPHRGNAQAIRLMNKDLNERATAKLLTIEAQVKRISQVTERLRTMDEVTSSEYIADAPSMVDLRRPTALDGGSTNRRRSMRRSTALIARFCT